MIIARRSYKNTSLVIDLILILGTVQDHRTRTRLPIDGAPSSFSLSFQYCPIFPLFSVVSFGHALVPKNLLL